MNFHLCKAHNPYNACAVCAAQVFAKLIHLMNIDGIIPVLAVTWQCTNDSTLRHLYCMMLCSCDRE